MTEAMNIPLKTSKKSGNILIRILKAQMFYPDYSNLT